MSDWSSDVCSSDLLVREGAPITFRVAAGDADGDPLQLSVVRGLPEGALFVPASGEFQWTPGFHQAGDHVVTFSAVDPSGAVDEISVTVRVADKIGRESCRERVWQYV